MLDITCRGAISDEWNISRSLPWNIILIQYWVLNSSPLNLTLKRVRMSEQFLQYVR